MTYQDECLGANPKTISLPPSSREEGYFLAHYVIKQSVCAGTYILDHLLRNPPGKGPHLAPIMLYRHAIDIGDSICTLLRFGSANTANILLRSLFETSLNLGFILENAQFHEDRASCYRAFRQIQRLKIHKRYDPATPEGVAFHRILDEDPRLNAAVFPRRDLSKERTEIERLLNGTEYKPFWDRYKAMKPKPRQWYTLYSGVENLRDLTKLIRRESEYALFYNQTSEIAHASDVWSGVLRPVSGKGIEVHLLRGPEERVKETTNLAANYLVDCHQQIQKTYMGAKREFNNWFAQWYFGDYRPFFLWATAPGPLFIPAAKSGLDRPALPPEELHETIAVRAYEIYEARTAHGALDDWLMAEKEVLDENS
jgi:hypothetical protein